MNPEGRATSGGAPGAQAGAGARAGFVGSAGRRLGEGGASALLRAFGHLLRQNDWARAKLAMFPGRRICIGVEAPSFGGLPAPKISARITEEGLLETVATEGDQEVDVYMTLRPSIDAAFALFRVGPRGLAPHLRLEGEVMLAAALGEIAEQLRWDIEEDLSRVTGDIVARRIGQGVESARNAMREIRSRLETSTGRHLAGDSGQLVGRGELESLRSHLDALERQLSRLEASDRGSPEQPSSASGFPPPAQPGSATVAGAALLPQQQPPLALPKFDFDPEGPGAHPKSGESG